MNKVSVITITFNNAAGLRKTLASVVGQTYTNYEHIVIDGGSTDDTLAVIKEYEHNITYWVSEPDGGIYNAMNKGIAVAKGDYVHFLNGGDAYASDDVLSAFFSEERSIAFIRGTQICNYGNRTEVWTNLGPRRVTFYDMFVNTMLHQATFIRTDLFKKYGLYDEALKITSDWVFFFKAILGGEDTLFIDKPIVDFEMYGLSTNREYGALLKAERFEMIKKLTPPNLYDDYRRMCNQEKDEYIVRFVKSNKFFVTVFKVFRKLCLSVGIGKE
ncbi:glycosyltransferase involved in cell wall biosynthesis [Dysgonomonas sp. PH5-45]|uniref:glycosyltransferase family 2 protein n=1 Tax=unclassified Dysgonomonas TaxID=2630389 RepID=UPI002475579E|nr:MULTISPECIES: glycosyltransferase family 2 protein [unclassified Dysgonomonas]MDH6355301.1 glycosyltransferase involved in cell wall biosynthesis [Dysgonomonas sp. PH5-45]MDH6388173.1 glycosyltransferase involved in cell wall biosynthesis [Dysgonomonas sp. PH5-37]